MTRSLTRLIAGILTASLFASCATTYDSQGRAVQTVTPEGAAVGALAAGLIGYSLSKNRKKDRRYHRSHNNYHRNHRYYDDYRYYGDDCY